MEKEIEKYNDDILKVRENETAEEYMTRIFEEVMKRERIINEILYGKNKEEE